MENGRADPLPFRTNPNSGVELLGPVYCFLEFSPWGEFRDLAGGDLDSSAGLWVAPVPCFSLRNREGAETYQGHPISFPKGSGNAVHRGVNRRCSLRFADFASACDFINEIGFVHEYLLTGLFGAQPNTGRKNYAAELGNLMGGIFLSSGRMSTVKIRAGSLFCTLLIQIGAREAAFDACALPAAATRFSSILHKSDRSCTGCAQEGNRWVLR
jgi:hypothetical protein